MKKNLELTDRQIRIMEIKRAIKNGSYDWVKAIEDAAEKILQYPESLLWK